MYDVDSVTLKSCWNLIAQRSDFKILIMKNPTISIIIPTLNEAQTIGALVGHLFQHKEECLEEIIVVDGGSTDNTVAIARATEATVIACTNCGRAPQMNKGAAAAKGSILYFVHSDTMPPASYLSDIQLAIKDGYKIGCFRGRYKGRNPLLRINSFFTRFNKLWCRGGDQTLFINRTFFEELGQYRSDCIIMEEYELIQKAQEVTTFKIIPKNVIVSTRKYEERSYLRVQWASLVVFRMYNKGVRGTALQNTYKRLLG